MSRRLSKSNRLSLSASPTEPAMDTAPTEPTHQPLGDVLPEEDGPWTPLSEAVEGGLLGESGDSSGTLAGSRANSASLSAWLRDSPSPAPQHRLTPEMSGWVGLSRGRSDASDSAGPSRRRGTQGRRPSNSSLLLLHLSSGASGSGSGGWWRESGGSGSGGGTTSVVSGSSREGSSWNLSRLRSRSLGQSCPNLNLHSAGPSPSHTPLPQPPAASALPSHAFGIAAAAAAGLPHPHPQAPTTAAVRLRKEFRIQRRASQRSHRRSFHAGASPVLPPRCRSPSSVGSMAGMAGHPRLSSQMHHYHGSGSGSYTGVGLRPSSSAGRGAVLGVSDTRRWSLASLPSSSGYGTPGSSAFSSQYSSTERLGLAHEEAHQEDLHQQALLAAAHGPPRDQDTPSSSHSTMRPRSRSLSSPTRLLLESPSEALLKNHVYKERFPRAKGEMEERLRAFLASQGDALSSTASSQNLAASSGSLAAGVAFSDGATRFLLHQVLETAADCLAKSHEDRITSAYFLQLNENLNELVAEAKEKAPANFPFLAGLVRELLLIVARPARLLECLEFNPEDFYHWLEEAEGQVRSQFPAGAAIPHFPQYIVDKLGLGLGDVSLESDGLGGLEPPPSPLPAQRLSWTESMLSSTDSGLPQGPGHEEQGPGPSAEEGSRKAAGPGGRLFGTRPPVEEDFETVKLISNGAYGAVWLVRHVESRERFALKKLSKRNMMLRNAVEAVFAERDILTFADNPFVVSFYGSFETKSHLCMVMEYVEGGDCASLLKACGALPLETAKPYIAEAVLAVEYLHSYGIVHRDIKPDNLLITAMGHVKLTDFGLSKIGLMNRTTLYAEGALLDPYSETHQFQDQQLSGTPEYIAPECILRQGYGKPVDWWALGIITFEFLCGTVPFAGATPEELFMNIVQDEVMWGDEDEEEELVEAEAKDLVAALLAKNPLERLGTLAGAEEVKAHPFFADMDYRTILKQKAEFIPQLDSEEDTSYFDTRAERYNHAELEGSEGEEEGKGWWGGFSSPSPRHSFVGESGPHFTPPPPARAQSALEDRRKVSVDDGADSAYSGASDGGRSRASSDVQSGPRSRVPSSLTDGGSSVESTSRPPLLSVPPVVGTPDSDSATPTPGPGISRRRTQTVPLPRFAISCEADGQEVTKELSPVDEKTPKVEPATRNRASSLRKAEKATHPLVSKSSSLHLVIPASPPPGGSGGGTGLPSSPGASSTSSRDDSPSRSSGILSLKPPVMLRKGPRGFGFTIRSVRVYLGEASEYYTIQHIISAVDELSPAFEAGLRPDELITHVHGEAVQNLTHPQLMQRLFSYGDNLSLRTTPLDQTTIRTGAPRKSAGKLARKKGYKNKLQRRVMESKTKRKASLLRRLSGKRASGEVGKPPLLPRSVSSQDSPIAVSPPSAPPPSLAHQRRSDCGLSSSPSSSGSSCSSPATSSPHSPAVWQSHRPSSLHGLRSKLAATILKSPGRRKPSATIPLSPLARVEGEPGAEGKPTATPKTSSSPTRSPSPLTAAVLTPPKVGPLGALATAASAPSQLVTPIGKKTYTKPRKSDPGGSDLLRLALNRPPSVSKDPREPKESKEPKEPKAASKDKPPKE